MDARERLVSLPAFSRFGAGGAWEKGVRWVFGGRYQKGDVVVLRSQHRHTLRFDVQMGGRARLQGADDSRSPCCFSVTTANVAIGCRYTHARIDGELLHD